MTSYQVEELTSAMGRLGGTLLFSGTSDVEVTDFTRTFVQLAVAWQGNPKHGPVCAASMASRMQLAILQHSPAYPAFKAVRAATSDFVAVAETGKFLHHSPTSQVLEAALGPNAQSQPHRDMATRELEQRFGPLIQTAETQGLVVTRAAGLPSARPVHTPGAHQAMSKAIIVEGEKITPQLYAFMYIVAVFELRYGEATLQQELAFKQLTQGSWDVDNFAQQIRQRASKLRHRAEFDESYCVMLFVQGLNNKECSAFLAQQLACCAQGTISLDKAVLMATQWIRQQELGMIVSNGRQVAARLDTHLGGKNPTSLFPQQQDAGGSAPAQPSYSQLKRQLRQAAKQKYGPDHPDAPCTLPGHGQSHSNAECEKRKQAAAQQAAQPAAAQQYRQPAAALPHFVSPQDVRYPAADQCGSSSSWGHHQPVAAMQPAGAGKQVRWADQQRAAATHYPRPQQQQQFPQPPGLGQQTQGASCNTCGFQGGHRGPCYYDRPDMAPGHWAPSARASQQVLEHYKRQCVRHNVPVKEPRLPEQRQQQQGVHRPAGALSEWEQQWEPVPAQATEQQYYSAGEPQSWFPVGSLAEDAEPAAVATRGRQPHSFLPADNTQPRVRLAAAGHSASSAPVPLQVTLNINLDPGKLLELLTTLCGQQGAAETAASLSTAADESGSSAAALQQQPVEHCVMQQLEPMLPDAAADPDEVQALLARHAENSQVQHLHIFSSTEPSSGVTMQWGPHGFERHAQPPRAASDSGCVPSVISESLIKSTGLRVRDLTQAEREQVRGIDGTVSSRIYGRTEPITIILCKGTPQEVSLTSERGFLAVRGDEAATMYDMVIGRDLLDRVSGFVVPLTNRFCYMPRVQYGDLSLHSMPVVGGRAAAPRNGPMQAALLADALLYMPVCAAVLSGDEPQELQAAAQLDAAAPPQPGLSTEDAAKPRSGSSRRSKRSQRRRRRQTAGEEIVEAFSAVPGETLGSSGWGSRVWGVVRALPAVIVLLLLWPPVWLLQVTCSSGAAQQPHPGQGPEARSSGRKANPLHSPWLFTLYALVMCTLALSATTVPTKLLILHIWVSTVGLAKWICRGCPADVAYASAPTPGESLASRVWWGARSTVASVLLMFLWPALWLVHQACKAVYNAAVQPPQCTGTIYWRLGRGHRSAAGETIYLRTDARSSGRKPRIVHIQRPCFTWRYALSAVPAKVLIFLLMLAAVSVTSTQAMQTYRAVAADGTSLAVSQPLVPPLPCSVTHLLAAGMTGQLGPTGKCFRG